MTKTGPKKPAAPVRAAVTRNRAHEHAPILSRDAVTYAQDADDIEIEAFSDDVIAAAHARAARVDD